jgi:hypothetical protein
MRQPRWSNLFATYAIAASIAVSAAPAFAIGYYNLPGNVAQWMGCGYGAGYHAFLVLGPTTHHGWCAHHEVRLAYPPAPSCGRGACYGATPAPFVPSALPPDHPEYLPPPAAMRPQILR